MKERLNDLCHLLVLIAVTAVVVMLFMGIAFELTAVTAISGIIAVVCIFITIGIYLYIEEVL